MAFDFNVLTLDNFITPSIIIFTFGLLSYFFGRIITSQKPLLFSDKFNDYWNGINFMISFVVIPAIGDFFICHLMSQYEIKSEIYGINLIVLIPFIISAVYLVRKTRLIIFKITASESQRKRLIKDVKKRLPKNMAKNTGLNKIYNEPNIKTLFVVSLAILLTPISYIQSSVLVSIVFIGISFLLFSLIAFLYGYINPQDTEAEIIDIDNTRIKGKVMESGERFVKIVANNNLHIIPTNRIKEIKIEIRKKEVVEENLK